MPEFSSTNSIVPPCAAETLGASPPSVPPGKTLTLILPPLLAATSSANLLAPISSGWPFGFCSASLKVLSCACAALPSSASAAAAASEHSIVERFIVVSWAWGGLLSVAAVSAGEPLGRHGHQLREEHHQEHHRELRAHERH